MDSVTPSSLKFSEVYVLDGCTVWGDYIILWPFQRKKTKAGEVGHFIHSGQESLSKIHRLKGDDSFPDESQRDCCRLSRR